jgi:hypothetical protein
MLWKSLKSNAKVAIVAIFFAIYVLFRSYSGYFGRSKQKDSFDADLIAYKQLRQASWQNSSIGGGSGNAINYWRDIREKINLESLDAIVNKNLDYHKKSPFPHMVEDDLFPESLLRAAIEEIPDSPKLKSSGCVAGSSKCFNEETQKFKNAFDR